MTMTEIEVTVDGETYIADLSPDGSVDIWGPCERDNKPFAGSGKWTGQRVEDCGAALPDAVYDAIDAALRDACRAMAGA